VGYLPWFIFLAIFLQVFYWLANGGLDKLLGKDAATKRLDESSTA
jgi:hypothetical protein